MILDARFTGIATATTWQTLADYLTENPESRFTYITLVISAREDGIYITEVQIPYFS